MRRTLSSFQRVLAAEVISSFGSLMSRLAIPWLAVLVLQATPSAMAWLSMANVAAGALAALLLGALVDAWPKRRTMIAADIVRAATLLSLPLLAAFGTLTLPWLVAVVAINGVMTVAFELAQSAWIARSTDHEDLSRRNAALAAGGAVTEAASFGVTGWLFQWLGAVAVMVIDAATYVASALLLLRIDEPLQPPAEPGDRSTLSARVRALGESVRAGLGATLQDPVLRTLAVVAMVVDFAMSFAATTYMIYVSRDLALPTGILGVLFALGGIGSLVASWITARSAHRAPARTWLIGSLLVWAVGSAAAPAATTAGLLGIALIAGQQIVGDAGGMAYGIADRTLRQQHAPPALLARVDASVRTLGYAATFTGAVVSGVLADRYGARALLFASSALLGVAALAALRLPRSAGMRAVHPPRPDPLSTAPALSPRDDRGHRHAPDRQISMTASLQSMSIPPWQYTAWKPRPPPGSASKGKPASRPLPRRPTSSATSSPPTSCAAPTSRATGPVRRASTICRRPDPKIPRRSARASRPSPTATCTSATRRASA